MGMDLGIDFFMTTLPWCSKLKDLAREEGVEIDGDEPLVEGRK